jgi:hypothetical protein
MWMPCNSSYFGDSEDADWQMLGDCGHPLLRARLIEFPALHF